jgi:hypothetical protein
MYPGDRGVTWVIYHTMVFIGLIEKPQKCIFDEKQGYDARFRAVPKSL